MYNLGSFLTRNSESGVSSVPEKETRGSVAAKEYEIDPVVEPICCIWRIVKWSSSISNGSGSGSWGFYLLLLLRYDKNIVV